MTSTFEKTAKTKKESIKKYSIPTANDIWEINSDKNIKYQNEDNENSDSAYEYLITTDKNIINNKKVLQKAKTNENKIGEANNAIINNNYQQAKNILVKLIQENPYKQIYYKSLGYVYEQLNDIKKSLKIKVQAAILNKSDSNIKEWNELALKCLNSNEKVLAEYCYFRLSRLQPYNLKPIWSRINLLLKTKDYRKLVDCYTSLLVIDKSDSKHLNQMLELCQTKLKSVDLAIKSLEKIYRDSKNNNQCNNYNYVGSNILCQLYICTYRYSDVVNYLKEMESMIPIVDIPIQILISKGISLLFLKKNEEADELFDKLLSPNLIINDNLIFTVACAYLSNNFPIKSEKYFNYIKNLDAHKNESFWYSYGHCCLLLGKYDIAEMYLKKIINNESKMQNNYLMDARLLLSTLYSKIGKDDLAMSIINTNDMSEFYIKNSNQISISKEVTEGNKKKLRKKAININKYKKPVISSPTYFYKPPIRKKEIYFKSKYEMVANQCVQLYKTKSNQEILNISNYSIKEIASANNLDTDIFFSDLMIDFFIIICKIKMMENFNDSKTVSKLTNIARYFVNTTKYKKSDIDENKLIDLIFLGSINFYRIKKYDQCYDDLRGIILKRPNWAPAINLFADLLIETNFLVKYCRFATRHYKTIPYCKLFSYLGGYCYLYRRSYVIAINIFTSNYINNSPLLNLYIGVCYILQSFKRTCKYNKFLIVLGFVFLHRYHDKSKKDAISCYNLARCYQYVGVQNLACHYYNKVFTLKENFSEDLDFIRIMDVPKMELDLRPNKGEIYKKAANRLSYMYKDCGSVQLAKNIEELYL